MTTTATVSLPSIEDLFVDPRSLPSPSASVLEILRRADDPDVSMSEIADLVDADVAIAVQVLRMANSALYSPAREITTISRALSALGLRAVKLLALTTSLRSLVPQRGDAIDLSEIRHRMVVTASVARRAAQLLDASIRDEAFVSGLLTGIGPVVLATEAPEACRALLGGSDTWPTSSTERALLGFTTDDVTAELITKWGLPPVFAASVRHRQGRPDEVGGDEDVGGIELSLHVASLAEPILTGRDDGSNLEAVRELLVGITEMDVDEVDAWLIEAQSAVADTAAMLQFRVTEEVAYAELLGEAAERLISLQVALEDQLFEAEESADLLVKRNDELEVEASTDALTNLPNRRAFDRCLAAKMESPSPLLGLLLLDLDHFKSVNDTYGHAAGDDVLRYVGATLGRQVRIEDFTARLGGEEFVMLIASTTHERLLLIAERLRASIAELVVPVSNGSSISVTVSIGGAIVGEAPGLESPRSLIEAADARLYEAKQSGRNRSCLG